MMNTRITGKHTGNTSAPSKRKKVMTLCSLIIAVIISLSILGSCGVKENNTNIGTNKSIGSSENQNGDEIDTQQIPERLRAAARFVFDWYVEPKYIDLDDSIPGEYGRELYAISDESITSVDDLREKTHEFFSSEAISSIFERYSLREENGKLYISRSDGLGGPDAKEIGLAITKESEASYQIEVRINYGDIGDEDEEPIEDITPVNLVLEDGNWVFDSEIWWLGIDEVEIHVLGES